MSAFHFNFTHPEIDRILVYPSIDSTNLEALRQKDAYPEKNIVLVAREQTAGKGQRGRQWASARDKGLYFSLLIQDPGHLSVPLGPLSLYMGIIVQRALAGRISDRPVLKWPNDIMLHDLKLGGILTEIKWFGSRASSAVLGVGLNVSHDRLDFPSDLQPDVTSVKLSCGHTVSLSDLLEDIIKRFFADFELLSNPIVLMREWNALAWKRGQEVNATIHGTAVRAVFQGINEVGEAGLLLPSGLTYFSTGDLSIAR